MREDSRAHLTLAVEGISERLVPVVATVTERLGQPFRIACTVATPGRRLSTDDFILKAARLDYRDPAAPRPFCGLCTGVRRLEAVRDWSRFQLDIRPAMWRLTQRRDSRIYQQMSPQDVILDVLERAGVERIDNRIQDQLPPHDFIVQYCETDFAFVSRLMETHGFGYFFTHGDEGDTLVLFDDSRRFDPVPGHAEIPLHEGDPEQGFDSVRIWDWTDVAAPAPQHVASTDYDFTRARLELDTTEPVEQVAGLGDEIFHYPGHYFELEEGGRLGRVRAQAIAAQTRIFSGATNSVAMAAGRAFSLTSADAETDPQFVVVAATHGFTSHEYGDLVGEVTHTCGFDAIPLETAWRMPRRTPRPVIPGIQTGVVVGPPGEEIHTDEWGRVKVRFRWDREGSNDASASCWIRVATPWAGTGWGQIHVPRIGHEVVVQFEEGDPDRPVVTGMLYNSSTGMPDGLPGNAAQMGIRSNTTPGGGGANEILMRDTSGSEMMTVTAQRDLNMRVKNDADINIGYETGAPGSLIMNVHQDRTESVSNGDYKLGVETGNRNSWINTNDTLEVGSTRRVNAPNVKVEATTKYWLATPLADMDATSFDLDSTTVTVDAENITITGSTESTLQAPSTTVTGTTTLSLGSATIEMNGTGITITGDSSITLTVGGSTIEITGSAINITSTVVNLNS